MGTVGQRLRTRMVEAVAAHEGDWWEVTVPELGLSTSTRDRGMVEAYARSLAAAVLGVAPGSVVVIVRFVDGGVTA